MANAKIDTKEAVKEINNLIEQFNLLIKATGDVSTISKANFRKVETALEGLRKVAAQSNSTFNQLNAAQKRVALAANNEATALRKTVTKLKNTAKAANDAAISQDKLEKNTKKTTSTIGGLLGGLKSLIGAFGLISGIQIFGAILKSGYDLVKQFDSISLSLRTVARDSFEAATAQRFLLEITEDFGVELVSTAQRYVRFLAAAKQSGVTLKDTEDIFRSMTKAGAVLGLGVDDLSTVYLALEQMMSKGKVTTEELRRQLGEKLPGAVGIMAAAIGVGVEELDSLLKKGEVLSVDALPKFAKAVELAYGIQNVDNIKNIISEQNRLTNAWEIFVKSVTEGSGFIGGSLSFLKGVLGGTLKIFTPQSIIDEAAATQKTIELKKKGMQEVLDIAKKEYDSKVSLDKKYDALTKATKDAFNKYNKRQAEGASVEELKILHKKYQDANKVVIDADKAIFEIEQNTAIKKLSIAQKLYDGQKKIVDEIKKDIEDESWVGTAVGNTLGGISKVVTGGFAEYRTENEKRLKSAQDDLAKYTANLEVLRKLTERAMPVSIKKDDEDATSGRKPATFEVKEVKDLSNEVAISALKNQQELNNELLAGDKASYDERQKAAMDNVGIGLDLAQIARDEEIEKAQSYHDKMLDDLEDAIKKKSILDESQLTEKQFRIDLEKNLQDATLIATQNQNKAVLNVEQKFAEEQLKLAKLVEDNKIAISDSIYNKQIIAAKEAYNASNKTAEDQKKLDEALTKASIEQGNAQIEIRIATLESLLEYGDLTETQTKDTILLIEKLKASLQTFKPGNDLKEEADKLIGILELVGEAAQAITDLGSAIFDRKIENINAEIEAEKNKYDTLIDLAKNNKDEQVRLQAEKDAKIKELEAKRLKEEQKKAKFEKANALIQIAINTAIAVSKATAQTGVGFVVPVPLIIALGAIQAATVLAQPIPKYKDGLKNAKEDHLGMINDGGRQEFIERDGNILTTSTKNAIINLKKGDTIHKSYEDMIGNDMFSNLSRSIFLNNLYSKNKISEVSNLEKVFDKNLKTLNKDLKQGIRDGFKNVNIHNHTSYDAEWIKFKNNTL